MQLHRKWRDKQPPFMEGYIVKVYAFAFIVYILLAYYNINQFFMEKVVSDFLRFIKIPVSEKYVRKIMASHPDFPSLLSIADTLQRLGINHAVGRIEKETLAELPYPYLLPIDKGRSDILLIKSKQDLVKHKKDLEQWSGIVLQAEPPKKTIDKTNHELFLKERRSRQYASALLALLAILLLFPFVTSFSGLAFTLLITSVAGVVVGYFIFAKEMGVTYTLVDAFCNPGKTAINSCDILLKADISWLGIKFSDAVLTYFIFQALALGFVQALPQATIGFTTVLAWLSVVTLPIVLFSLYYQYFVAKTWCRLCLMVVGVLAIHFSIFAIGQFNGSVNLISKVSFASAIVLAVLFAVIGLTVLLIKSMIEHGNQLSAVGAHGNRVKHDARVFTYLLGQQRKIDNLPFEKEMRVGSPDAPIQITMASNLYCKPCKLKHAVVEQLVAMYPDKVSVALRFVKSGKEIGSVGYLLSYWHQNIYGKGGESQKTADLMHDWFDLSDLQQFMKKYPVKPNDTKVEKLEAQHYAWIEETTVRQTPTFFINGYEMPKEYGIDDLLAMVSSLADSLEKSKEKEMILQSL